MNSELTNEIEELLATNPSLDGIRQSIANYWYTSPEKIDIVMGEVFQSGKLIENFYVEPHLDGYKFIYRDVT